MTSREHYSYAEIIDDDDEDTPPSLPVSNVGPSGAYVTDTPLVKRTRTKKNITNEPLKVDWTGDEKVVEIGVDEVGRGPLFGRVYTAAVILPKDGSFDGTRVKDSKKYHSKKKIEEAYEYVKTHALAYSVNYQDEQTIDCINILQATQQSMHQSIHQVIEKYIEKEASSSNSSSSPPAIHLLIDGNYFHPVTRFNRNKGVIEAIPHTTIEGGDNKSASIAAASILAKVERDRYIEQLCRENPSLVEHYGIDSNKGYGTKKHLDGIKTHGITSWHRRSFAPCKHYEPPNKFT